MSTDTISRPISDYRPEFQVYVRDFLKSEELAAVSCEDYARAAYFRDLQITDTLVIFPDAGGIYTIDPALRAVKPTNNKTKIKYD
jgi:hypothetical protein